MFSKNGISFLVFLLALTFFITPAFAASNFVSYQESGLTKNFELVTSPVAGRAYTPTCIDNCHLVVRFNFTGYDYPLRLDNSVFSKRFVDKDNKATTPKHSDYVILREVSYKETIDNCSQTCNPYEITNGTNTSTVPNCTSTCSPYEVEKTKLDWLKLTFPLDIYPDTNYYIDLEGSIKIGDVIDAIPTLWGNELPFAWWNATWQYRRNFTTQEPNVIWRTNWQADMYIDSSAWGNKPYNDTIRIVNSSGNELPSQVWNITQTGGIMDSFTVTFLKDYTLNQAENLSMYYNPTSTGSPSYSTTLACSNTWLNSTNIRTNWDIVTGQYQYWGTTGLHYSDSSSAYRILNAAGTSAGATSIVSTLLENGPIFCRMAANVTATTGTLNTTIRMFSNHNFYEHTWLSNATATAWYNRYGNHEAGAYWNGSQEATMGTTYTIYTNTTAQAYNNNFGYAWTEDEDGVDVMIGVAYDIRKGGPSNNIMEGGIYATAHDGTGTGYWLLPASFPYKSYRYFELNTTDVPAESMQGFTKRIANPITLGALGAEETPPDTTPPLWSANKTSPTSPTTYAPSKNYQFNITCIDTDDGMWNAWITFNGNNYAMSNQSSEYYHTLTDLATGTYSWSATCNNTQGNANTTVTWSYIINKNATTLHLAINGTESDAAYTYPATSNATAWADVSGTYVLWRNGTNVSNPNVIQLAAAYYNYTANYTHQNYTATSVERFLTINKGGTSIKLYKNSTEWASDSSIAYPEAVNISATLNISATSIHWADWDDTEDAYGCSGGFGGSPCANAVDENWGTGSASGGSTQSIVYENYTSIDTNIFNRFQIMIGYDEGNAAGWVTLSLYNFTSAAWVQIWINNYAGNNIETVQVNTTNNYISNGILMQRVIHYSSTFVTYYYESQIRLGIVGNYLERNSTLVSNPNITLPDVGAYNYTSSFDGDENYTASSNTKILTVNSGANPVHLYLNGTLDANKTYTYPSVSNATATAFVGTALLWRDGISKSNPEIIQLGAGTYAYKSNVSASGGYSANDTGVTYYAIVNQGTPSISVNPITAVTYPTATQTGCERITGDSGSTLTLYRNGTQVAQSTSSPINETSITLGAGVYNYTCTISGTTNYTSGSSVNNYRTVNKKAPSFTTSVTSPITYGTASDYTGSESNSVDSDCSYILQRNGTQIATGSSVSDTTVLAAESYNYTYFTTGCTNFTSGSDVKYLTVNKANNPVNLYLNNTQSNKTYTYPQSINATATATAGTALLWRDGVSKSNPEQILLGNGTYAYKSNTSGNANYSANNTGVTYYALVNKATATITLYSTPASPITYGTQSNITCIGSNPEVASNLYRNNSLTSGENNTLLTLPAGTWNYTCNSTSTGNYTAAADSLLYVVNQAASGLTMTATPSWNVTSQQSLTISCSAAVTPTLYKDTVVVSNPYTAILPVGSYAFVCSFTNANYTPDSTSNTLIVSQPVTGCTNVTTFAYYATVPVSGDVTLDFTTLKASHVIRSDLTDVWLSTSNATINTNFTGGDFILVNSSNVSSFTIYFGNYYNNLAKTERVRTNSTLTNYTYASSSPYYIVANFINEMTGMADVPPNVTSNILTLYCSHGSTDVNITSENDTQVLVAAQEQIDTIEFTAKYSPSVFWYRDLIVSSPIDTKDIYIADATTYQVIQNIITLQDNSLTFTNPVLHIAKTYGNGSIMITERAFDVENKVVVYLINGQKYSVTVTSGSQSRTIGDIYVDNVNLQKIINIGSIVTSNISFGNTSYSIGYNETTGVIIFAWKDPSSQTINTTFTVVNYSNTSQVLYTTTSTNASSVGITWTVPDVNGTYIVRTHVCHAIWGCQSIGGNLIVGAAIVALITGVGALIAPYVVSSPVTLVFVSGMFLSMIPMIFGGAVGGVAAIILALIATLFAYFGLYPVSVALMAFILILAILNKLKERRHE